MAKVEERRQEEREWKKEKKKKKKPRKERTIKVKRIAKEWEIWNEEEEAAISEVEARKLVSEHFHK